MRRRRFAPTRFRDRAEAGRALAAELTHLRDEHPVVLGVPGGGVPVAAPVAEALDAPLDVLAVRKLGAPQQPELALGAIGEGGVRVLDEGLMARLGVGPHRLDAIEERERVTLENRVARIRAKHAMVDLTDRTVIVIDDGVATGASAEAACRIARARGAARVVLATPVGPPDIAARLHGAADEVVCVLSPAFYHAVGQCYDEFHHVTDDELLGLLERANERR